MNLVYEKKGYWLEKEVVLTEGGEKKRGGFLSAIEHKKGPTNNQESEKKHSSLQSLKKPRWGSRCEEFVGISLA